MKKTMSKSFIIDTKPYKKPGPKPNLKVFMNIVALEHLKYLIRKMSCANMKFIC